MSQAEPLCGVARVLCLEALWTGREGSRAPRIPSPRAYPDVLRMMPGSPCAAGWSSPQIGTSDVRHTRRTRVAREARAFRPADGSRAHARQPPHVQTARLVGLSTYAYSRWGCRPDMPPSEMTSLSDRSACEWNCLRMLQPSVRRMDNFDDRRSVDVRSRSARTRRLPKVRGATSRGPRRIPKLARPIPFRFGLVRRERLHPTERSVAAEPRWEVARPRTIACSDATSAPSEISRSDAHTQGTPERRRPISRA
jgi:hypothetical protein